LDLLSVSQIDEDLFLFNDLYPNLQTVARMGALLSDVKLFKVFGIRHVFLFIKAVVVLNLGWLLRFLLSLLFFLIGSSYSVKLDFFLEDEGVIIT
jgi:hypothetical protein